WGKNNNGQMTLGNNNNRNSPEQIGTDKNWINITTGYRHTLGLKSNGVLWTWGHNSDGQLGDASNASRNDPVQVAGTNWISLTGGDRHSMGIKVERIQYCFTGYNG